MAKQTINLGTAPSGSGGDTPRSAFTKAQENFDELYTLKAQVGANSDITSLAGLSTPLSIEQGGTGGTTQADARTELGLGTAAVAVLTVSEEDSFVGRVLKVGDWGIGVQNPPVAQSMNRAQSGFSVISDSTLYRAGAGLAYATMISAGYPGGNYGSQIYMGVSPSSTIGFRSGDYAYAPFLTIYHTGNTTRAADGTLKAI